MLWDWVDSDHLLATCFLLGTNVHIEGDHSDRYSIPELCHGGGIPYPMDQGL
jgi:hypothetical protein